MVRPCNSAQVAASPLASQINLLTTDWERAPCLLPEGDLSLAGAENAPTPLTFECREAQRCRKRELSSEFARYFKISPYTGRGLGLEKNFVKIKPNKPVLLNQASVLVKCPQRGFGLQDWVSCQRRWAAREEQLNTVFLNWERSPGVMDCPGRGSAANTSGPSPRWMLIPISELAPTFLIQDGLSLKQDGKKLRNTKIQQHFHVKLKQKHLFFDYLSNFQKLVL